MNITLNYKKIIIIIYHENPLVLLKSNSKSFNTDILKSDIFEPKIIILICIRLRLVSCSEYPSADIFYLMLVKSMNN